jgi:hypothetical protein
MFKIILLLATISFGLDLKDLDHPYREHQDEQKHRAEMLYRFVKNAMEETMGREVLSDSLVIKIVEQVIIDFKK